MIERFIATPADAETRSLVEAGDLRGARDRLKAAADDVASDPLTTAWLGLLDLELGDAGSAVGLARRTLESDAGTAATGICGWIFSRTGMSAAAFRCFESVLRRDRSDLTAILGMGGVLHDERRFDEAIALYTSGLEHHPHNAEIHNQLGRAYNNKRELPMAREAFSAAVAAAPDHAEAHHNLGHVLRRLGNLKGAADHFKQALREKPDYFSAHFNLGTVNLTGKRFDEAEQNLKAALELQPDDARVLYHLGACLLHGDKPDAASDTLEKCVRVNPEIPEAWTTLALVRLKLDRNEEALAAFDKAYGFTPSDAALVSHYAAALAKLGEDGRAAGLARELLAATPQRPAPHTGEDYLRLGNAMRYANRLGLATECYRVCVSAAPDDGKGHLYLAAALVEAGDIETGYRVIDGFLERCPTYQSGVALKITILQKLGRIDEARDLLDLDGFIAVSDLDAPGEYPTTEAFNAALSDSVLAEPSLLFERSGHATRKGRHTGSLDLESEGPYRDLALEIEKACVAHMDALPRKPGHPLLGRRPTKWALEMWSVVMDRQGHQVPHTHNDGYLSGVYYPQLPDVIDVDDPEQQGWIEFGRPAEELIGETKLMTRRIQPKTGRLVVFPSYFVHHTVPFDSDRLRISVAFDLRPLEWEDRSEQQVDR